MSIFSIGGPKGVIVSEADLKATEDDRYFMPGIIHGSEDYIIQVYYWSNYEGPAGDRIGARYLYAADILDWAKQESFPAGHLNEDRFTEQILSNSEEFVVLNDGSGDFVTLNDCWAQALPLSYQELISWAKKQIAHEASQEAEKDPSVELPRAGQNKLYYLTYRREHRNNPILVEAPGVRAAVRYLQYKIPDGRIIYGTREATPEDKKPWTPVLTLTEKEERDIRKSFLASEIEDMDLTVRTYHALRRANINTVQELINMTEKDLLQVRNLGWKCMDEIKAVLAAHGESLSPSPVREEKTNRKPSLEDRIHSVAHYAEDKAVREAVLESDKLRNMTLDTCYNIPGYTYLQTEDQKKLYDMVKKSVSLSLGKGKTPDPERE